MTSIIILLLLSAVVFHLSGGVMVMTNRLSHGSKTLQKKDTYLPAAIVSGTFLIYSLTTAFDWKNYLVVVVTSFIVLLIFSTLRIFSRFQSHISPFMVGLALSTQYALVIYGIDYFS